MRLPLLTILLLFATAAPAAEYRFTGFARDLSTGELLYVETHEVRHAGKPGEQRTVLYRTDLNAEPFARKTLHYGQDRTRPAFQFTDLRSGFAESVSPVAGGFRVTARAGANAVPRSVTLNARSVAVIDAGFDEFVQLRWSELQSGKSLNAPFLVPSRLDAIRFQVRKVGDTRVGDADATVIRLSLAGVLGWVLPDIDVTYRNSDRRLLRYRGLTNIRDADGELLTAQIDFPDDARQ